jgi:hypothetical protein
MIKEKAYRACLFVLPVVLLVSCSISELAAPNGDEQETPTGAVLGAGGGDNQTAGGGANGGGDVDSIVESNSYGIYVHAVVTGKCGAYTNSAGFKDMDLEASFEGIVFSRPMGKGLPGPFGGLHRKDQPAAFSVTGGLSIDGSGDIQRVEYCPQYETDVDTFDVNITSDINRFQAWIGVMSPTATDAPEGVNPTKTPVGGGEAWVMFHIGNALNGGPIWEYEVNGAQGQEDETTLGEPVRFITSWDRLMKGEDFTIPMTSVDEGETWEWEMRLVPEPIR